MAWNWKNNSVKTAKYGEQPMSRLIASWIKAGGKITDRHMVLTPFYVWLTEEIGVDSKAAIECIDMAVNGKMELEDSAKVFLRNWDRG